MFTQAKSLFKSNMLLIIISSAGFLFSLIGGIIISKVSDLIIFALIFLGAISLFYLIYKDMDLGLGIFIGSMLLDYSVIPIFSQNASISKIIGILILGLCILKLIIEKKTLLLHDQKSIFIGIFFLWGLFSLLYVKNIELGIARITTLFQLILTYTIIVKIINNLNALKKVLLIVTIIGFIVCLASIIYLIKSPEIIAQNAGGSIERYGGTNDDPNMFAQNFLVIFPFFIFFYLHNSRFYILAIIFSIFVVLSTYSRGALLGLAVMLILSTPLILQIKTKRLLYILLAFSILIFSVMFFNKNGALTTRIKSSGRGSSTQTRLELLEVAIDMGMSNYITGVGLGNFIEHSSEYGRTFHIRRESHNGFFDVFATLGLPGFIIFFYIIYLCIKDYWLAIRKSKLENQEVKHLSQFILISFIGFLITGFFLGLIFSKMFWNLIAFSSISRHIAENTPLKLKNQLT
jgi:O-antigen ligase